MVCPQNQTPSTLFSAQAFEKAFFTGILETIILSSSIPATIVPLYVVIVQNNSLYSYWQAVCWGKICLDHYHLALTLIFLHGKRSGKHLGVMGDDIENTLKYIM